MNIPDLLEKQGFGKTTFDQRLYEDLGMDSLDMAEICVKLSMPYKEMAKIETVGDLQLWVDSPH